MVKKEEKINVSSLKKLAKEIETVGEQSGTIKKIEKSINELMDRVEYSIRTNLELQEKVAEAMIHLVNILERMSEKQESPDSEEQKQPGPEIPESAMQEKGEVNALVGQNKEMAETLKSLRYILRHESTKEAIKKAIERSKSGR